MLNVFFSSKINSINCTELKISKPFYCESNNSLHYHYYRPPLTILSALSIRIIKTAKAIVSLLPVFSRIQACSQRRFRLISTHITFKGPFLHRPRHCDCLWRRDDGWRSSHHCHSLSLVCCAGIIIFLFFVIIIIFFTLISPSTWKLKVVSITWNMRFVSITYTVEFKCKYFVL